MGMKNQEAVLGCQEVYSLTPSEFLFLFYLAFVGNDADRDFAVRGEAWPGEKTIKKAIGLNEDTSRKAANRMSKLGILTVHKPGYKDRSSKTYLVHYDKLPLSDSPTPTRSITDPQSADYRPPLGDLPMESRRSTDRTGIERELEKEDNLNTNKKASSVRGPICSPQTETSGETPESSDYEEKLKWAKGETKFPVWAGWKKFTDNPKSFKTACLESETFNNQFRERKKKPAKSGNPAHAGDGFLTGKNGAYRCGSDIASEVPSALIKCSCKGEAVCPLCVDSKLAEAEKIEEKRRYDAPRTCAHCKIVDKDILRYGYCADCIHHHPDRELHWHHCKCERCVAYRLANPRIKAAATTRVNAGRMFDEDEL